MSMLKGQVKLQSYYKFASWAIIVNYNQIGCAYVYIGDDWDLKNSIDLSLCHSNIILYTFATHKKKKKKVTKT